MDKDREKRILDEDDQFNWHTYQHDHAEVVEGHAAKPATNTADVGDSDGEQEIGDDSRLHIKVNGEELLLHNGLQVKHAIGPHLVKKVRAWQALVRDNKGNIVDVDGALMDGQELFVTEYEDASEVVQALGLDNQEATH